MLNFKNFTLTQFFYTIAVLTFLVLPVVSLYKVSQYRSQDFGLYPVEVGGAQAGITSSATTLSPGDEATISVKVNADDTLSMTGFTLGVIVPKPIEIVTGSEKIDISGGISSASSESISIDNKEYTQIKSFGIYSPAQNIDLTKTPTFVSFKVKVPAGTASGDYAISFRSTTAQGGVAAFLQDIRNEERVNVLDTSNLQAVTLKVSTPNNKPSINMTSNTSGTYTIGDEVVFTVTATDPDSGDSISKVEFSLNGTVRETKTSGSNNSYSYTLNTANLSAGNYTLQATAYDSKNATANVTADITLQEPLSENESPTVNITAPTSKVRAKTSSNNNPFNIAVSYSDDSRVSTVLVRVLNEQNQEMFKHTQTISNASGSFATSVTSGLPSGNYTISVEATDEDDAKGTASRALTVNKLPTISLTKPSGNTTVSAPATVELQATASDVDSQTADVSFYRLNGNQETLISNQNPYSWSVTTAGTYTVFARVTDDMQQTVDSSAVTVTVTEPADLSDARDLTISILLEGRVSSTGEISEKGHANDNVFVGLWRESSKKLLESAVVKTNRAGTVDLVNFFNENGDEYTLEDSDVIIVKPESYLSQAFPVSTLTGGSTASKLILTSSSNYKAGDTLVDTSSKFRVGQNLVDLGSFDKVSLFDYTLFKIYISYSANQCSQNIPVSIVDYTGDNKIDGRDYAAYMKNLDAEGDVKKYDATLATQMETILRQNVSAEVLDLSNITCRK